MSFSIEKREKFTLVKTTTEKLDSTLSPELKAHFVLINGEGQKNIILDMSATRYCDSSGLSAVLIANRLCKAANGTFILCGAQESVLKLIQISQLYQVLNIIPTLSEAEDFLFMEEIERDIDE
jgi:anti-sigma B factor antagonist